MTVYLLFSILLAAVRPAEAGGGFSWDQCGPPATPPSHELSVLTKKSSVSNYFVCVDAVGGLRVVSADGARWPNALPHQDIYVLVRHDSTRQVRVEYAGQVGLYLPAIEVPSAAGLKPPVAPPPTPSTTTTTIFRLPRFLPGTVQLRFESSAVEEKVAWASQRAVLDPLVATVGTWQANFGSRTLPAELASPLAAKLGALKDALAAAVAADQGLEARKDVPKRLVDYWKGAVGELVTLAAAIEKAHGALLLGGAPPNPPDWARVVPAASGDIDRFIVRAEEVRAVLLEAPATTSLTWPMVVEPTYNGSLRLGVAVPFGAVADGAYRVGMPPDATDSAQLAVLDDGSWPVDLEVVIGYSQYLHRVPASAVRPRLALFGGLGVLDLADARVTTLQSVYAGLDFGYRRFSFGGAFTVRNVTRLANGLQVGDPVASTDTDITVQRPQVGFSLVFMPPVEIWQADFTPRKGAAAPEVTTPPPVDTGEDGEDGGDKGDTASGGGS